MSEKSAAASTPITRKRTTVRGAEGSAGTTRSITERRGRILGPRGPVVFDTCGFRGLGFRWRLPRGCRSLVRLTPGRCPSPRLPNGDRIRLCTSSAGRRVRAKRLRRFT